jgi:hypothetical protein
LPPGLFRQVRGRACQLGADTEAAGNIKALIPSR